MIRNLIVKIVVVVLIVGLLYAFLVYSGRWDDFVTGMRAFFPGL